MAGILSHAWLLVACIIIVRCAVSNSASTSDMKPPKKYFIETKKMMSLNASLEYCKNKGMSLASFVDEEGYDQLYNATSEKIEPGSYLWLAFTKQRDVWTSIITGDKMVYKDAWDDDEPQPKYNAKGEKSHCAVMHVYGDEFLLAETVCSNSAYPICEQ